MENSQLIISVLGLVVALGSTTATYIYFRISRRYKELSFEIRPTVPLVSVGPEVRERVEIKYKQGDEDLAIEDLKAVPITIRNTGTEQVSCRSKDFQNDDPQKPITLDFGQHAQIVGVPITETNPEGLTVLIKRDPQASGKVLMDTFLLDRKETVTISTFLTNFSGHPRVDWRIEGVRPPRELNQLNPEGWQPLARSRSGGMKPVVATAVPLLTALGSSITTGTFSTTELSLAITGLVTALVVALVPPQIGAFAASKAVAAALTPVVSVLIQSFVTGSFGMSELTTAVVGLSTANLVYFVQPPADA